MYCKVTPICIYLTINGGVCAPHCVGGYFVAACDAMMPAQNNTSI